MKVWPDNAPDARPAADFFVNERIDLLIREAETFRNDYRNKRNRIIFHALKKPLPWAGPPPPHPHVFAEPEGFVDTQRFCGFILVGFIAGCCTVSILVIARQNRMTR